MQASRCPGRAPPLAGLRGPSRRLGRLPLALVPTFALALGGLLPELLEEGAPRVDVDHGDASTLVIAPLSVPFGPSAAVLLVGCHDRGLRCVTSLAPHRSCIAHRGPPHRLKPRG